MEGGPAAPVARAQRVDLGRWNREAPTAFGAAPLQHDAAVLRLHSNEEPVGPPAMPTVWLVGAFHGTPDRATRAG